MRRRVPAGDGGWPACLGPESMLGENCLGRAESARSFRAGGRARACARPSLAARLWREKVYEATRRRAAGAGVRERERGLLVGEGRTARHLQAHG